ncbi:MAG TPA: PAS domain S-box protein [Verrucomicrobiae bacterium]|nr:PAS domain S-box protein [Verrucomicrobiae bacterium]
MPKSSKNPEAREKNPEPPQLIDERFKLIARATNDVFWDWDLETNAVWRSEGASKTFGYPPDELVSDIHIWIQRIHPEDRSRVQESIQAAITSGREFWRAEYRFRCKDGLYAAVLDRGYVVHNAKGKPVRMVGALSDISRPKEMETKLKEDRNLLRTLVDNLPDYIYAKDMATRKTLSNAADVQALGCTSEAEVLGKTDFDFFPREIAEQLYKDDLEVLKGHPHINREEKIVNSKGDVFWTITTKVPRRDAAGNIIGLVGGGRDITQQKEAELKLMAERNLLRAVIDNLPDAIYAKDAEARKTLTNKADLSNLGCASEAEVLGKTDFDIFPHNIAAAFFADDQAVLKTGQPVVNREEKVVRPDGGIRWLLTTKVPWYNAAGKTIGLVGIGRDITDKKHLEEQFLRAQRLESIGRLATGIAHDLNNILAPILISTTLLRQKIRDDEGLEMLARVEASAKRGADIVRQVLGFGRGLEGQRMPVNPQLLIKDVTHITTETFSKAIHVETAVDPDVGFVSGDITQLHQVLLNLCVNARDAMPQGGKLTLRVRNFVADALFASRNPEAKPATYVLFEVTDTGHGIPPEVRDRIFEPFFTTKELGKGTGLGLSTTLSIIKSHGGFITVESEPEKGSSFQVYLPAMPPGDLDKVQPKASR